MRANRGDFATPGTNSPFRERSPAENLARFREMRDGKHPDGAMVLRAKIDMASPNINLRDPAIYRIKHAEHHNTGNRWCIYPMYTYAHPIEDALGADHAQHLHAGVRGPAPFYDWLLDTLCTLGLLAQPRPHQYEFARLNVTYVITSKRKLKALVDERIVDGWDDRACPPSSACAGAATRRAIRLMLRARRHQQGRRLDRIRQPGHRAARRPRRQRRPRAMAVIDPAQAHADELERGSSAAASEPCHAPAHPQRPELGERHFGLGPALWIERDDFAEVPPRASSASSPATRCASSTA